MGMDSHSRIIRKVKITWDSETSLRNQDKEGGLDEDDGHRPSSDWSTANVNRHRLDNCPLHSLLWISLVARQRRSKGRTDHGKSHQSLSLTHLLHGEACTLLRLTQS